MWWKRTEQEKGPFLEEVESGGAMRPGWAGSTSRGQEPTMQGVCVRLAGAGRQCTGEQRPSDKVSGKAGRGTSWHVGGA